MPGEITLNIESLEQMELRLAVAPFFLDSRASELISFISCCPYPAWIKDYDTRMIYVNPAYETEYKVTVEEYNTKLDFEMWHNDSSKEYGINDKAVMESHEHVELQETYVDIHGGEHILNVVKWPLSREGDIIGVAGMVIPTWQRMLN